MCIFPTRDLENSKTGFVWTIREANKGRKCLSLEMYVPNFFYMLIVFFIHKIFLYINVNSNKFTMFYSLCHLSTGPVNFITLTFWRREKQVPFIRFDYYVSLRDFSCDDSSHF